MGHVQVIAVALDYMMASGLTLSAHQPAYLPWLGYFEKIARADVFVFLDSVQFEKNSFINRNRIKTPQGLQWLTVPVKAKGHLDAALVDMLIDNNQPWIAKHLRSIRMNYAKAPCFDGRFQRLEKIMLQKEDGFVDMCLRQLQFWMSELDINTSVVRSSKLPIHSKKSQLILDLCKHFQADRYLSGMLGKQYLDEAAFSKAGIEIEYQQFDHPVYPQLWGDFQPCLSVVDYWLNCGPHAQGDIHGL